MRLRTSARDLSEVKAELAICFAYEDDKEPRGVDDDTLRGELAREMKAEKYRARAGDVLVWNADGRFPSRRFAVIGLGREGSRAPGEALRRAAAKGTRTASRLKFRSVALCLPGGDTPAIDIRAATEGAMFGAYHFDRYITDPDFKPERLTSLEIAAEGPAAETRRAAAAGETLAKAVCVARDLVNEPPSVLDPVEMARRATRYARDVGVTTRVFRRADLVKMGMGGMLAVSRGSAVEPRLVHMTYRPAKGRAKAPKIVLVGKGVTFDSGGLNLKPGNSMLTMKCDMAGAAAVVATMTALAGLDCRAEVHGLVGLVENMTGGDAYKPGDILKMYSGKTVEIGNTDAEGRLVLADVLAYAAGTVKPAAVVDLATLTGACVVALGTQASGLFGRDEKLGGAILDAAQTAGEKVWPMPMYEEYLESLQGGPADLRNIGDRWGGAITAALFLGEFVPRDVPWVHLDIAGPAFTEKNMPEAPAGGTGAGVATVLRWLETA